jgi:hypothetical protein
MQDRLLNSYSVKRISILLDILLPFMLYYSMNNHNQILSWFLVGIVVIIRILLVTVSK